VAVTPLMAKVSLDDHVARFPSGPAFVSRAMSGTYIRPALQGLQGELTANPGAAVPANCWND
jgi:hypothetical protein